MIASTHFMSHFYGMFISHYIPLQYGKISPTLWLNPQLQSPRHETEPLGFPTPSAQGLKRIATALAADDADSAPAMDGWKRAEQMGCNLSW